MWEIRWMPESSTSSVGDGPSQCHVRLPSQFPLLCLFLLLSFFLSPSSHPLVFLSFFTVSHFIFYKFCNFSLILSSPAHSSSISQMGNLLLSIKPYNVHLSHSLITPQTMIHSLIAYAILIFPLLALTESWNLSTHLTAPLPQLLTSTHLLKLQAQTSFHLSLASN